MSVEVLSCPGHLKMFFNEQTVQGKWEEGKLAFFVCQFSNSEQQSIFNCVDLHSVLLYLVFICNNLVFYYESA